jgi:GNAT superfamily N-acetyltransferase
VGFAGLSEGRALYAGGAMATVQEFYVARAFRNQGVGAALIHAATELARQKGWQRLEVCTPPLPEFDRSLAFYERNGFEVTGGRKLKRLIE